MTENEWMVNIIAGGNNKNSRDVLYDSPFCDKHIKSDDGKARPADDIKLPHVGV